MGSPSRGPRGVGRLSRRARSSREALLEGRVESGGATIGPRGVVRPSQKTVKKLRKVDGSLLVARKVHGRPSGSTENWRKLMEDIPAARKVDGS